MSCALKLFTLLDLCVSCALIAALQLPWHLLQQCKAPVFVVVVVVVAIAVAVAVAVVDDDHDECESANSRQ